MHFSATAVLATLVVATSLACNKNDGSALAATPPANAGTPASAAAAGGSDVLAEVDGLKITRDEVDKKAAPALQKVREDEYEARKSAVDELVMERLLDREAKARNITREELLKQEVEGKAKRPSPAELEDFYNKNRERVGGRTFEQIRPELEQGLFQRAQGERARAYMAELRTKAKVLVTLQQPRSEVPIPADAQIYGPKDAKITLVEYSDYLCPYCQQAQEVVDKVLAANPGKMRFIHRDYLLGRPRSLAVARAALCAGDQGKFWEYRNSLMTQPGDWSDNYLTQRAASLALKTDAFTACVNSPKFDAQIQQSSEDGQKLGVSATPTFFINGKRMQGARSPEQLQEVIDAELARIGG